MIGQMIAESANMGITSMHKLLNGVAPEQFARLAVPGDQPVQSNHPAFILGHLSLYPSRVVADLGGDATAIEPSEKYNALFSPAATCLDDPQGTLYPPMAEIVSKFDAAYQTAIDVLGQARDDQFSRENPNERMRSRFATVGSMHAFYLGGHTMIHVGQFSAWRRMMGLGQA